MIDCKLCNEKIFPHFSDGDRKLNHRWSIEAKRSGQECVIVHMDRGHYRYIYPKNLTSYDYKAVGDRIWDTEKEDVTSIYSQSVTPIFRAKTPTLSSINDEFDEYAWKKYSYFKMFEVRLAKLRERTGDLFTGAF